MKLSTSLVAVKKITSACDRSAFSQEQIDQIARLILKAEGIINPLILCRTSFDTYEVVEGDLEYYASVKAREIDPLKGEHISAFILDSDNEEALKNQIQMLRSDSNVNPILSEPDTHSTDFTIAIKQIEGWIQRLENSLQIKFEQSLQAKVGEVLSRIDRLEKALTPQAAVISTEKPETKNYQDLNLTNLKKIAKQRGLKKYSGLKKHELVALLKTTEASQP